MNDVSTDMLSWNTETAALKHRFVCAQDFGAMMSCIYEAWLWENHGFTVELAVEGQDNYQLFCTEHYVEADEERTEKVIRSIRRKISSEALQWVYYAAMSVFPERLEVIYRFLRIGFKQGRSVTENLAQEPVMRLREISRRVGNESHKFIEFVRFSRGEDGILVAVIEPRSDVLTLIAPHFSDRMPSENWMILDRGRRTAVVHEADRRWYLRSLNEEEYRAVTERDRDREDYARLWKCFFDHIAIAERANARCQMNFLPKWYRANMTEFRVQ